MALFIHAQAQCCTDTLRIKNDLDQVSVLYYPDIQSFFHCFTSVELFSCIYIYFICPIAVDSGQNAEGNQDKNLIFCDHGGLSVHVNSGGDRPLGRVESSSGERKHNM